MGNSQCFVVALHGKEPGFFQPGQRLLALGATIDQVANAEQAIAGSVEPVRIQGIVQTREVAMDIAHGKIAPCAIGTKVKQPAHTASHAARGVK
ncbi:hypothetical protein D3C81_1734820 [compost metagenome]